MSGRKTFGPDDLSRQKRREAYRREPDAPAPMLTGAQAELAQHMRALTRDVEMGRITYVACVCARPSGKMVVMNHGLIGDIWKVIGLLTNLTARLNRQADNITG